MAKVPDAPKEESKAPQVSDADLLMAAATIHEQGRLFEPLPKEPDAE
jgi:hypothetical protein